MYSEESYFVWQPFVPGAGANVQAVFNTESGAAVNTILLASSKISGRTKYAEVFIKHPGLNSSDYTDRYITVNELEYEDDHWKTEFINDSSKKHFIEAVFIPQKDNRLLIEITAHNNSDEKAEWIITVLSGVNSEAGAVEMAPSAIKLPNGTEFACVCEPELYSSPPLKGHEHLDGLGVEWGNPAELKNYPHGFAIRYGEWIVNPGESPKRRIILGTHSSGELSMLSSGKEGSNARALNKIAKHMFTQLKINRRYPSTRKVEGRPFATFTPCASMEYEYSWDAGFTGAGLAVFDPPLSELCIRQYLPEQPDSIWMNSEGAPVPTQIIAAWELYQQTRDKDRLKRLYPGLHKLWLSSSGYCDWSPRSVNLDQDRDGLILAPNGGSGLDDAPSQVWARGYSIDWARQEHYWLKPIVVNNTGKCLQPESVNMTCFTILCSKILRHVCGIIDIAEPFEYGEFIKKAEASLQSECWNEETKHFHWVVENTHEKIPYYDISGLCPIFSSSYSDERQREILITELFQKYMTPLGLTSVDPKADFYRKGYWCGAIWIPFQWLFWKWFIGQGRLEEAKLIARNFLSAYEKAYLKRPCCFEKIDLETAVGCGDLAFGALAAPVVNLWAAYYKQGTLSLGYETVPVLVNVAEDLSFAEITLISEERSDKTGGLIVMKESSDYILSCEGITKKVRSDENGVVQFAFASQGPVKIEIKEMN